MSKIKILFNTASKFIDKNLPTILTGAAILGLGGAVATAIKETPKAMKALDDIRTQKAEIIERESVESGKPELLDKYRDNDGALLIKKIHLTPWEYTKTLFPIYWPTALLTISTGACIISSNRVSTKRNAALLTALSMSEANNKKFQEKVREVLGDKKVDKVNEELAKDYAMDAPDEEDIQQTPNGSYLCFEPLSKTYFRSNIDAVGRAFLKVNQALLRDGIVSLNDLLCELEINELDSYLGSNLCWTADSSSDLLEITYKYESNPRTGEPCMVICYHSRPVWQR